MGAGASTSAGGAAAATVEALNLPEDTSAEDKAKINAQLATLNFFVDTLDKQGANESFDGKFPVNAAALKDGVEDADKLKSITKALATWNCHRYMHGSYLLAKNIDKVNKFYEDMGPVAVTTKEGANVGVQITRKSLKATLKKAEKHTEDQIKAVVNQFMHDIGKERPHSGVSEAVYEEIMKKLVAEESDNKLENWEPDAWEIIDESKCPKAAMIKKDLDKLTVTDDDTCRYFVEQTGISRNENREYWLKIFSEQGEAAGLAKLEEYNDWLLGKVEPPDPQEYDRDADLMVLFGAYP